MADTEGRWVTIKGHRIFLAEGETPKEYFAKQNAKKIDDQQEQIAKRQREADELNGKSDNNIKETKSTKEFHNAITEAKATCAEQDRWRVDVHEEKDYEADNLFVSKGGSTIAITKDGDIISVCKYQGDSTNGSDLLKLAVSKGGTKLDSYSGNHRFYTRNGFEAVSWTPFNREYASDEWKAANAKGLAEEEPVVFYKYVGIGNVKTESLNEFLSNNKPFTGDDGYDNAMKYRDSQIKK